MGWEVSVLQLSSAEQFTLGKGGGYCWMGVREGGRSGMICLPWNSFHCRILDGVSLLRAEK